MIKVFVTSNMTYTPFKGFHEIDLPFFEENGVEIVEDVKSADVIVSQHFKQLQPYFLKFFNSKKYLIWTLEPRFNTCNTSIKHFYLGLLKVHVMNIYTGDVFAHPLSFHNQNINKNLKLLENNFKLENRKLVGLMSFYKGLKTEPVLFNNIDVDLIKKRTEIAFYGYQNEMMDVFGKNWPQGMSKEDSRDGNWTETKKNILHPYHFNLCFENTAAPRYTTEKIWDSIENLCLPVYYGEGTDIYKLFPENSFIDYSLINNPKDLFLIIKNMSCTEYVVRMNKCINIYNSISALSKKEKNDLRIKTLSKIIEKMRSIV